MIGTSDGDKPIVQSSLELHHASELGVMPPIRESKRSTKVATDEKDVIPEITNTSEAPLQSAHEEKAPRFVESASRIEIEIKGVDSVPLPSPPEGYALLSLEVAPLIEIDIKSDDDIPPPPPLEKEAQRSMKSDDDIPPPPLSEEEAELLGRAYRAFRVQLQLFAPVYLHPELQQKWLTKFFGARHTRQATVESILERLEEQNPNLELTAVYLFIMREGIKGQDKNSKVARALQKPIDILSENPQCKEILRQLSPVNHTYLYAAKEILLYKAEKETAVKHNGYKIEINILEHVANELMQHFYARQNPLAFYQRKVALSKLLHDVLADGVVKKSNLVNILKETHAFVQLDTLGFDETEKKWLEIVFKCLGTKLINLNPIVVQALKETPREQKLSAADKKKVAERMEKLKAIVDQVAESKVKEEKKTETKEYEWCLSDLPFLKPLPTPQLAIAKPHNGVINPKDFAAFVRKLLKNKEFQKLNDSQLSADEKKLLYGQRKEMAKKIKELPLCDLPGESLDDIRPAASLRFGCGSR